MFAALLLIALVGIAIHLAFTALSYWLLHDWHESARASEKLRGAALLVRRRGAPRTQIARLTSSSRARATATCRPAPAQHGLRAHALAARRKHRHAPGQAHLDGAAEDEGVITDREEVLVDVGSAEDCQQASLAADRGARRRELAPAGFQ